MDATTLDRQRSNDFKHPVMNNDNRGGKNSDIVSRKLVVVGDDACGKVRGPTPLPASKTSSSFDSTTSPANSSTNNNGDNDNVVDD